MTQSSVLGQASVTELIDQLKDAIAILGASKERVAELRAALDVAQNQILDAVEQVHHLRAALDAAIDMATNPSGQASD